MPVLNANGPIPAVQWVSALKPLLDAGYTLRITPEGHSMVPFLLGGRDTVLLQSPDPATLRRGDIILYPGPGGQLMLLHRVHHIRDGQVYPLGDARTDIEDPLPIAAVAAVVVQIERKGRPVSCRGAGHRLLAGLWLGARVLRPALFPLWRAVRRVFPARR